MTMTNITITSDDRIDDQNTDERNRR